MGRRRKKGLRSEEQPRVAAPSTRRQEFSRALSRVLWRKETGVVAACLAVAAFFRFYNLFGLGLTHFDEGPYAAAAAMLVFQPGEFYHRCLTTYYNSPPLFPFLCGLCFRVFGVKDYVAILPSVLAGSLGCLVVYWLGKRVDGPATGFWSAILLAVNEYHAIYSRLALTDMTFLLFFCLVAACAVAAWQTNRWPLYTLTGLSAGMAVNTKYNGFVPLLLAFGYWAFACGMDCLLAPLFRKTQGDEWLAAVRKRLWGVLPGAAAGCALFLLMALPWWIGIRRTIGLETLKEALGNYSVPFGEAWRSFRKDPWEMLVYFRLWSPGLLWLAPLGFLASFWRWRKEFMLIYAWLAFYYFALFCYFRYTRLALPLLPPLCVLSAALVSRVFGLVETVAPRWKSAIPLAHGLAAAAVIVAGFIHLYPVLSLDTDSYRKAAVELEKNIRQQGIVVVDTLANFEFYLDVPHVRLNDTPSCVHALSSPYPKYFVFDDHVRWSRPRRDFLDLNRPKMQLLSTIPNHRYPQIWLEPFYEGLFLEMRRNPGKFPQSFNIYIYQMSGPCAFPGSWKSASSQGKP